MDNEEIDASDIIGQNEGYFSVSYNSRDILLYALGIGCYGRNDDQPGDAEMRYLYEGHPHFSVFPTYPLVLPFKGVSSDVVPFPGPSLSLLPSVLRDRINPGAILHYDQYLEIEQPLDPTGAELLIRSEVVGLYQRRSGVLLRTKTTFTDRSGERTYCKATQGTFIRGLKISGDVGPTLPSRRNPRPRSPPDTAVSVAVSREQALLYRLSGDYNAIHANHEAARSAGLDGPILHGLCSLGIAVRQILLCFCEGDPSRLKSLYCRFSRTVRPGEELEVMMWRLHHGDYGRDHSKVDSSSRDPVAAHDDVMGKTCGSVFRVGFDVCSKIGGAAVVEDGIAVVKGGVLETSRSRL